jgi:hypothetical protein
MAPSFRRIFSGVSVALSPNDARHVPVEAVTDVLVDRLSAHIVPRHGGVLGSWLGVRIRTG